MSRSDDYIIVKFLIYPYHQNYYKLIGIDLSRQINMTKPQQISFTGKLRSDNGAAITFIT